MSNSRPSSAGGTSRPPATPSPKEKEMSRPRSSSRLSSVSRPGSAHKSLVDDDSRTAVKVAVRVRPPLDPADPNYDLVPQRFRGSICNVLNSTTMAVESPMSKKLFLFDRVFAQNESQEDVWEYVSDSVRSFVQGYNVSILAYGQSGAGKSYTMGTTGAVEQADANIMGIIPRAAASLFEKLSGTMPSRLTNGTTGLRTPTRYSTPPGALAVLVKSNVEKNWQLRATYVEIYNEQLRDLLVPESVPQGDRPAVTIREDTKGRILLTGLKQVTINNVEDLLNALNFGSTIRQTDSTAINSQSSRSHAVFSLNLIQKRTQTIAPVDKRLSVPAEALNGTESWVTIDSKLHFVDLAGSERLKNSGLTGERVKEGISINAGLASLGKVISQLSSRSAPHVSYRDSRLTRLLQDSLGGNAITYMIACINPVEFHLSETLNTVQYAQRARAIQSKPQIQQRMDDGDKQLIIDRLRSEVAFLRDQIRLSERSERRNGGTQARKAGKQERENELQNQLLDIQENYSALSQRHAKLISEIAMSKGDVDESDLEDALQASSLERLNRSNNFAEAVEQVVMEYEKTIQSLESSLSNTRASLATSESSLLEKEAKIVYMEAVQQQLQSRVQKAMTREANSESYLKNLESKLEGISSGEEKHLIIIQDLRTELSRIRESESSAEDYICTLEERLAEAEQDTDIMQREILRLEHVVERQRSIGKLDNLLYELDHIKHNEVTMENGGNAKAHHHTQSDAFHDRLVATASAMHPNGEVRPEDAEEEWKSFGPMERADGASEHTSDQAEAGQDTAASLKQPSIRDDMTHYPTQARVLSDKLETVTCELFDLRVEHESTITELDDVSRKYQIALSTLAELQDAVDGGRHPRPVVALDDDQSIGGDRRLSSRNLSPELSSAGEPPSLVDPSDAGTTEYGTVDRVMRKEETLADSVRRLRRINAEKDIDMAEMTENYHQLQEQHKDTLNYIEELKDELQRVQVQQRPLPSPTYQVRRNAKQMFTLQASKDRETRAFASLHNMCDEHLENQPELKKQFESQITAVMNESQLRSDRMDTLEADLTSVRKDLEVKSTMIAGLTRERSYRNSAPVDMSVIASLKDQLVESQTKVQALQESKSEREKDLLSQIQILKTSLTNHAAAAAADFPDTPATETADDTEKGDLSNGDVPEAPVEQTQRDISNEESKPTTKVSSLTATGAQLLAAVGVSGAVLGGAAMLHDKHDATATTDKVATTDLSDLQAERAKHEEQVLSMQKEIDNYKSLVDSHTEKLKTLEDSHTKVLKEVESDAKSRELTESELQTHRDLVMNLEDQIDQQKSVALFHQQGLKTLQDNHAKEMDELKKTMLAQQEEATTQLNSHQESASSLREELTKAHMEMAQLMEGVSRALNQDADPSTLHTQVMSLVDEHRDLSIKHEEAQLALEETRKELQGHKQSNRELEDQLKELASHNNKTIRQLEKSTEKEQKSSRLVQELEEQLNQNFEEHRNTNNRLSSLQKGREDLTKELEDYREKCRTLETQLHEMKRMTMSSVRDSYDPANPDMNRSGSSSSNAQGLRKSASHSSIPSPPPAVPLPPLPGTLNGVAGKDSKSDLNSPPPSRHQSRDMQGVQGTQVTQNTQLIEEQEARIRTMEKHLYAEKQLTQTLEEALVDLETQANKTKADMDMWRKRCKEVEEEAHGLRKKDGAFRHSLQAVEEERDKRIRAEQAQKQLEDRMQELARQRKSKKSSLNCF